MPLIPRLDSSESKYYDIFPINYRYSPENSPAQRIKKIKNI